MTVKLCAKSLESAESVKQLFTLREAAEVVGGLTDSEESALGISRVVINSREDCHGAVFVAIKGDNFDGHDFVGHAFDKGAVAAIVSEKPKRSFSGQPLILVEDTVEALASLAAYHRKRLDIPVVGITGSCGKTTTKELLAASLAGTYRVAKPEKSFNNIIGVSLTILGTGREHDVLILELGTNAPGEIARLCEIGRPNIGIITNIGHAHLEKLGSIEGVKKEKAAILKFLGKGGVLVSNADCLECKELAEGFDGQVVAVGLEEKAEHRVRCLSEDGERLLFTFDGFRASIPTAGAHNAVNAGLAAAAAEILGLDTGETLASMANAKMQGMRMEREMVSGTLIINDAYNSNFESLKAAVKMLDTATAPGRKVLVCGDMLELGPASESLHKAIGWHIGRSSIDILVTVGANARLIADQAHESGTEVIYQRRSVDEAGSLLARMIKKGDMILFKASRGMRFENAVKRLKHSLAAETLMARN